jgi:hypothetical protein
VVAELEIDDVAAVVALLVAVAVVAVWQDHPVYPVSHVHLYSFTPSSHCPPFWQGFGAQSSMLILQSLPV